MKRKLTLGLLAGAMCLNAGCFINAYSSEPNVRMGQLQNQSEDLRQLGAEWRRIWFTDQPSHLTPQRIDGGVAPR